jgi:hypothetical protein
VTDRQPESVSWRCRRTRRCGWWPPDGTADGENGHGGDRAEQDTVDDVAGTDTDEVVERILTTYDAITVVGASGGGAR